MLKVSFKSTNFPSTQETLLLVIYIPSHFINTQKWPRFMEEYLGLKCESFESKYSDSYFSAPENNDNNRMTHTPN